MRKRLVVLFMGLSQIAEPLFADKLKIEQFISPETCGGCHTGIYEQWENSMHNLAHKDPLYVAVADYFLKGLQDKSEIAEAESCVKCHTPVGYMTGYPVKTSDDKSKTAEIATMGIQCDYCHTATRVSKMYNNGLEIDPGNGEDAPGTKRGPREDAESDFHDTAFSKLHTDSAICGTCHNVKHVSFGTDLETTYDEWKKGPYNSSDPAKRVTCQGCHMYQRVGLPSTGSTSRAANRGSSADGSIEREHIFTHNFVGGNSYIPQAFKSSDKALMAEERLKNAATLSIDDSKISTGELKITVTNSGAGHDIPTGLTDCRQMWLEVVVTDQKGKELFSSGKLDADGYLPENSVIFNTVYGDGKGKPVLNISRAREILKKNTIPSGKSTTESFNLGKKRIRSGRISVKLLYRSAPQKVLDLVAGKKSIILPIVTMAEIDKKI